MAQPRSKSGRGTREAIIAAGLRGFGERGFEATSTRTIAALAGTNIASISYHFGGKDGLRIACAERIVEVMQGVLGPVAAAPDAPPPDPAEARRLLGTLVRRLTTFLMLRPDAGPIAGFLLRELAHPSPALDTVYEGFLERAHRRLCALWAAATGREAESPEVRLAVFASIGQVLYFHLGRPVVTRRMDWPSVGPDEAAAVAETVIRSLNARLDADMEAAS